MECVEARRLLDAGLRPGSTDSRRAALGFHLARCAACRAYAELPVGERLLAALLDAPPDGELFAAVAPAPPEPEPTYAVASGDTEPLPTLRATRPGPPRLAARRRAPGWLRFAVVGALLLIVGVVAVGLGQFAMAAYTISDNLAAMRITAAPTVVPTPPLVVPSSAAVPSPSPLAGSAVLDAPLALPSSPPDGGVPTSAPITAAAPAATAAPAASITPVQLPPIGGPAPLPTLMATVGVLPGVASGEPTTILLLGSDRRPGESWQTRSDAIMVVRLEPARQRVALLSLPRDLIVSIPGYGQARINAATVYGDMYPELGGGAELARQTVSQLLGIPIDHVVRADFNAFTTAIDAIGGVDIVVEQELYDPQYPTMDYGYMEVYFPAGAQTMDGERALIYSRIRHMDSNYARNRRQQQVILGIMQRVREQNVLGQVQMLADLSTALRDDIQTDLSLDQMIGLAWAFRGLAPDQVERYALDETMVYEGGIPGDPYATLPASGAIERLAGQLLGE